MLMENENENGTASAGRQPHPFPPFPERSLGILQKQGRRM